MQQLWDFVSARKQQLLTDSLLHVSAVVQSVVIATIVAVAIGILVYRSPAGSAIATALAGTILTIRRSPCSACSSRSSGSAVAPP